MANEQDKDQFDTEGQKDTTGQQGQPQPTSEQGQSSTGQASPETGGTDTLTDQKADTKDTTDGSGGSQSGGFVGSQGSGSDGYLREGGATESKGEDIETAQPQADDTDIEGGSESSEGNPS